MCSAQVRATDRDGNRNGVVRYSLNHTKFSIDDVTGVITTGTSNTSSGAVLYDYDSGEREYMLTVFATGELASCCVQGYTAL